MLHAIDMNDSLSCLAQIRRNSEDLHIYLATMLQNMFSLARTRDDHLGDYYLKSKAGRCTCSGTNIAKQCMTSVGLSRD
jgi:hypothetical protein